MVAAALMTAPSPETGARKSGATRGRILDAAARTFRAKGYAGTTLNDIAAAAGMQAGSIYYHFASKEELLGEVLRIGIGRVFDAVRQSAAALAPDAPFEQRLCAAIGSHLAMLLKHGDYSSADIRIFGMVPDPVRRVHLRRRQAYGAWWRQLLAEGRERGAIRADLNPSLVRMLLLGAMNWSTEWYKPARGSIDAMAKTLCTLTLEGLLPRIPDLAPAGRGRRFRAG